MAEEENEEKEDKEERKEDECKRIRLLAMKWIVDSLPAPDPHYGNGRAAVARRSFGCEGKVLHRTKKREEKGREVKKNDKREEKGKRTQG